MSDERRSWGRTVVRRLKREYPDVKCALTHRNAYELTVATILSAQCTDEMVNRVTPALFRRYPTPEKLARARSATVEDQIRSIGLFRNKARNIRGMAQRLVDHHAGEVPRTMTELLELPGVARKTANVVLGTAYGIADGVVVDTHVKRLSARLGLTGETTPGKVERDLMEIPHESVYRVDPQPDGTWTIHHVTFDTTRPNGLLFSLDH